MYRRCVSVCVQHCIVIEDDVSAILVISYGRHQTYAPTCHGRVMNGCYSVYVYCDHITTSVARAEVCLYMKS